MKRFIIPAAGFGKRVGNPSAKELLFYDKEVKPLLYSSLDLAKQYGFQPVVISREDKSALNEELLKIQKEYNLLICLIKSSMEWPDTVRQSHQFWTDKNILVLPDSRFKPKDIILELETSLDNNKCSFATFKVEDLTTWGVVGKKENAYYVCEKPKEVLDAQAWGLIGFQGSYGKELLDKLHETSVDNTCKFLTTEKVSFFTLENYKDITRDSSMLR